MMRTMGLYVLVALGLALYGPRVIGAERFEAFDFALVGDPQIGYGPGAEYADSARFAQVVGSIAARGLGLTVIAGDLVQDRSLWQHWAFARVARRLPGTVLLVPGNHDVVDRASLADWRERHSPDYRDLVWHEVAFIALNSETLRDARISPGENASQWAFLERSLAAHKAAGRTHIVLVMHRPPFVSTEDEAEDGANWPPEARARLLSLARAHGVRWILAGHLHRTTRISTHDGIQIVVGAGSARSFDRSPIAYHLVHVGREAIEIEQIVVAAPPREAFAVPYLSGWTPRLFDFSLRHWLFTIFYGVAGVLALLQARRRQSSQWLPVTILLFAFAANMQLDIDELLSEIGRLAAKATGVYAVRHLITGGAALFVAVGAAALFVRSWSRATGERLSLLALGLLAPSMAWFCLSTMSHHDWGMFFNEGWWDLLILASIVGIIACALKSRAQNPSSGRK